MSFAVTVAGTPKECKDAIRKSCDTYGTGISRDEFEGAIPSINAEIDRLSLGDDCQMTVEAFGHATMDYKGTAEPQEKTYEQAQIKVTAKKV